MDFFSVMKRRFSVKADFIGGELPKDEELATIFEAAASAPDHGKLRPWRFDVYKGEGRLYLNGLLEKALKEDGVDASVSDKISRRVLKAPLTIVVKTKFSLENKKIPAFEQELSTMAATQNVLNAFFAKGMGAILVTGSYLALPAVERVICEENERILGLIYAGSMTEEARQLFSEKVRPHWQDYTRVIAKKD